METRFKFLGHPVHPMLIVVPAGLLSMAAVFDVAYVITGIEGLAQAAFWSIIGGVLVGLVAAVFGLIDWLAIPGETRARTVGLWHGAGNVTGIGLFAANAWLRIDDIAYAPNLVPLLLSLIGGGLLFFTAWLGGELVYRLRVAVDPEAHLDAPNSIGTDGWLRVVDEPVESERR